MRHTTASFGKALAFCLALVIGVACGDTTSSTPSTPPDSLTDQPDTNQLTQDTGGTIDPDTSAGDEDTTAGDAVQDSSGSDGGGEDGGDTTAEPVCPGGFGCPCNENGDCDAGACFDGPDGKVCAKPCSEDCPTGYVCKGIGDTDVFYLCVPRWTTLCSPCESNDDCKSSAGGAVCLSRGDQGSFCGSACLTDDDCPSDYSCEDAFDTEANSTVKQCKLKDDAAQCSCSKWATLAAKSTVCTTNNAVGSCKGSRACDTQGLSACDAPVAVVETCDGVDNDCDGVTDILPDTATCAVTATLSNGVTATCVGKPLCDKGKEVCTGVQTPSLDVCDGVDNDCDGATDLNSCDDDDACTNDVCDAKAGKCVYTPSVTCDDNNQCTTDTCDKSSGKCVFTGVAAGTSCDDNDACTLGDACADGPSGAFCAAGKTLKDCDDGNLCTDDSCAADKGCVSLPNVATETCYNGAAGTVDVGACKSGVQTCANGVFLGACVGEVVPAKTEQCDMVDDNCDGVTDDGCKVTDVSGRFAAVAGTVSGGKNSLRLVAGSESAASGSSAGAKYTISFGWLQRLLTELGGK